MKTWQKITIAVVCGGAIYGLGVASTVWVDYAQPINLLSGAIASICTIATGFTKTS